MILSIPFWNLGQGSLKAWDEALTGERIREMVVDGDWLTVHLYGEPDFNKPPLYYQLSVPVWYLVGPGEFAVRFWSVVFALACAILAYFSVVAAGGRPIWGLLAVFLLLTNPHWQNWTRMGLLDSGSALSVLAALRLLAGPGLTRRRALWAGLVLGAGALIKFPLVLWAIPSVALADWLRYRQLAWRHLVLATLVAVGIIGAWAGLQYALHGQAWLDFQQYNFVHRFICNVEGHGTSSRLYWDKLMGLARYQTILFLGAVCLAVPGTRRGFRRAAPELVFLLIWTVLILLTASKRATYLLPAYPFMAVVTAILLGESCSGTRRRLVVGLFAGMILLNMARSYRPVPDYQPQMAHVGTHIHMALKDGEFVDTSVQQERQVLAFYARTIPGYMPMRDLEKWIQEKRSGSAPGGYLVVAKEDSLVTRAALDRGISHVFAIDTPVPDQVFTTFKLTPVSLGSPVAIQYLNGW